MPNFWTSSYGLKGDPYAELRLTATGSRLGIPLSGGAIELQEIKMLNKLEAFGKQDEAINFAGELNKFDRGLVELKKNSQGRWIRAPKKGLGGYEFEGGGQNVELVPMKTKVYNMDQIMPSEAQVDFDAIEPELGVLEAPPHPAWDELELTELPEEAFIDEGIFQ